MKLKRSDVYSFHNVLSNAGFETPISTQFRYMLSKNLKKATAEIDETDALFPIPDGYKEYFSDRLDSFKKFNIAILPDGSPDQAAIAALSEGDMAKLNDSISAVLVKHAKVLEQVKILNEEKIKFLDQFVDIDFETVKLDLVPTISPDQNNHWEIWRLIELVVV